jgi:hypothetical protein
VEEAAVGATTRADMLLLSASVAWTTDGRMLTKQRIACIVDIGGEQRRLRRIVGLRTLSARTRQ